MTSADDIATRWVQFWLGNATRLLGTGYSGNVHPSSDGRDIYSYGAHFSMCHVVEMDHELDRGWPRLFLINGDSYSSTTTRHQSAVRGAIEREATQFERIIVPFTALDAAGIVYDSIEPLDVHEDRHETKHHEAILLSEVPDEHRRRNDGTNIVPGDDGLFHWTTYRHWLGQSLFRATYHVRARRVWDDVAQAWRDDGEDKDTTAYSLSSFDEQERVPLYFLCELPSEATSVKDALELLKPPAVKART